MVNVTKEIHIGLITSLSNRQYYKTKQKNFRVCVSEVHSAFVYVW